MHLSYFSKVTCILDVIITLFTTALLPVPYPMALGLIGPSKKKKLVLMTSARSDQSKGRRLRAVAIAASPPSLLRVSNY
jgi:hypothetical protein